MNINFPLRVSLYHGIRFVFNVMQTIIAKGEKECEHTQYTAEAENESEKKGKQKKKRQQHAANLDESLAGFFCIPFSI